MLSSEGERDSRVWGGSGPGTARSHTACAGGSMEGGTIPIPLQQQPVTGGRDEVTRGCQADISPVSECGGPFFTTGRGLSTLSTCRMNFLLQTLTPLPLLYS